MKKQYQAPATLSIAVAPQLLQAGSDPQVGEKTTNQTSGNFSRGRRSWGDNED